MFATFKMELSRFQEEIREETREKYYKKGLELYAAHKRKLNESLEKYLSLNGQLKASEIESDWFHGFKADVFLSHSHEDEKDVIAFAGWLSDLGLTAFIDSCVWGYADDLLRQIDDKYCVSKINSDGSIGLYNYQKRNLSTAHVHMILNGALMKMMNCTECLIFLETPNSLKTEDISNGTTNSGWIYSELLMSKYLQRKYPRRDNLNFALINEAVEHDGLSVEYDADISHLIIITLNDITRAFEKSSDGGVDVLDRIYYAKKILKEE